MPTSPFALTALVCSGLAAVILVAYLLFRPALTSVTKGWLLLGFGVFPIGAAAAGNVQGFESTKKREFCGSCHVMGLHQADANDTASQSLSARHARNRSFGDESCYRCHADYGMYGTVLTKMGGLKHVWYYTTEYHDVPLEEAKKTIRLRRPYPNENCMQCHSTQGSVWLGVPDHRSSLAGVRSGQLSCASAGCHGVAHPNFTPAEASSAPPTPGAP